MLKTGMRLFQIDGGAVGEVKEITDPSVPASYKAIDKNRYVAIHWDYGPDSVWDHWTTWNINTPLEFDDFILIESDEHLLSLKLKYS